MNTILWIFVALAFGLMLFVSLSEDIPDELGFLKAKVVETQPVPGGAKSVTQYKGWTIKQGGGAAEFSRSLDGQIQGNTVSGPAPEIGILCAAGKLDMRIDARRTTTGARTTPVELSGLGLLEWQKGTDRNVFPPDARAALGAVLSQAAPAVTLSYAEAGLQRFTLNIEGLKPLVDQLPASCRP